MSIYRTFANNEDSITIKNANASVIGDLYAIESFVLADRTLGVEEIRELG